MDAYTVKKLLPKVLLAIILVTLSWQLLQLAVSVSKGIGEGIRDLIFSPFAHLKSGDPSSNTMAVALVGGSGILRPLAFSVR
jgi:hypothetical protein